MEPGDGPGLTDAVGGLRRGGTVLESAYEIAGVALAVQGLFQLGVDPVGLMAGAVAQKQRPLLGVQVEHYVISSGLREIIDGSAIAGHFKEIYASEFYYDGSGWPVWPKLAVNFTAKTQFVYRINKGVLDVSDDRTLNASMPDDSKRVPFTNMIYLGDGLSDVPCMKMMRAYGGQAIAVYQDANRPGVEQLLRQETEHLARIDSLKRVEKALNDSIAVLDSIRQLHGTILNPSEIGGLFTTRLDFRYYIVVGAFKSRSNAESLLSVVKEEGYAPVLISFRNGFSAIGITPADDLQSVLRSLKKVKEEAFCPEDVWILVNE